MGANLFGFITLVLTVVLLVMGVTSKTRDICNRQPTISGLCISSTLGIYFDAETQKCKYMGCSTDKKLFNSLEDCERICNSEKHRRRRMH